MDCVNEWPINEPTNYDDLITLEGSIQSSKLLNPSIKQDHNHVVLHSHSDSISENNLNERNRYDGLSIENGNFLLIDIFTFAIFIFIVNKILFWFRHAITSI